jgi:predicted nucleic acid-binding protein
VGSKRIKAAVTDAGPLIHLAEIGRLPLLHVFEALHIPDAVWSETVEQGRVGEADTLGLSNVQRHTLLQTQVVQFIQDNSLEGLQAGELECLYLCQQIGASVLLTDDLAVREVAKHLHLTPVGSLGIVVRAYRAGYISLAEAESYIVDLHDMSSLFVAREIVELAIEELRKY